MRFDRKQAWREARRIIGLAWPVTLTSLNWTFMQVIDVAIVGHAGPGELGALAAGRALTFVTMVVGVAALSGIIVFASRYDGAGERDRCGDVLREGMLCSLLFGLFTAALLYGWATEITHGIGIAEPFVAEGSAVVRVMALAFPAQMLSTALSYFLEGVSRPARAMVVNLITLPLNAALAWAWVGGHFGLPQAGAIGAVSATAVISLLGAILMGVAVWMLPDARALHVHDLGGRAWRRAMIGAPRLIRFGIVPGIASGMEMAGFSYLITLSTRLGSVATDAFQAMFALHNLSFAIALGIASAAGVRAGNAVGEGDPEAVLPRTLVAATLLLVALGIVSITYVSIGAALAGFFSDRKEVVLLAGAMLRMLAPFILFDGLQIVFVYVLRSLGDQIAAGINGVIAFFLITVGIGWWLVVVHGGSPFALVAAAAAGMIAAALLQGARLIQISRRMDWQSSG